MLSNSVGEATISWYDRKVRVAEIIDVDGVNTIGNNHGRCKDNPIRIVNAKQSKLFFRFLNSRRTNGKRIISAITKKWIWIPITPKRKPEMIEYCILFSLVCCALWKIVNSSGISE